MFHSLLFASTPIPQITRLELEPNCNLIIGCSQIEFSDREKSAEMWDKKRDKPPSSQNQVHSHMQPLATQLLPSVIPKSPRHSFSTILQINKTLDSFQIHLLNEYFLNETSNREDDQVYAGLSGDDLSTIKTQ